METLMAERPMDTSNATCPALTLVKILHWVLGFISPASIGQTPQLLLFGALNCAQLSLFSQLVNTIVPDTILHSEVLYRCQRTHDLIVIN
jgi:hypothetical protein